MIGKAVVVAALAVSTWGGIEVVQQATAAGASVRLASDLGSSVTQIRGYFEDHNVPAGRFVVPGQHQLDVGTDLTVSDGDTLTASGTWSGSYCVVVQSAAGQTSYYDSTLARTSDAVVPAGACAALAAVGGL